MRVPLAETRYPKPPDHVRFYRALLESVSALPGVTRAAVSSSLPMFGGRGTTVRVPGAKPDDTRVLAHEVSAGYFQVIGTRLLSGRLLEDRDVDTGRRVAVVNEAFVRRFAPRGSALGLPVGLTYLAQPAIGLADVSFEIVGIVRDQINADVDRAPLPEVYLPYTVHGRSMMLYVMTALPPLQLERSVRGQVYALDAEQPVSDVRTLDRLLDEWSFAAPRFNMILLGAFSVMGLLLATVGVYGVIAYAVARQVPEFGVRAALGADRRDIIRLVLARGVKLMIPGIAIGLLGAVFAARVLSTQLFGVSSFDPFAFAAVAALMTAVGLAACLWPALRAARVSPMRALRAD
jgi:putative ABC transport system permease protein